MNPVKLYTYLMQSRRSVFDAVRRLTPEQYNHRSAIGLKSIGSTLTHLMVSEWYYVQRLQGLEVPPYEQWPVKYEQPPAFEIIEQLWCAQATQVRDIIASERDWNRTIRWLGFPDDTRGNQRFYISATAGDFLMQLALHEVHHRAQLMAMIRESGAPPLEDLDYNALMFDRQLADASDK